PADPAFGVAQLDRAECLSAGGDGRDSGRPDLERRAVSDLGRAAQRFSDLGPVRRPGAAHRVGLRAFLNRRTGAGPAARFRRIGELVVHQVKVLESIELRAPLAVRLFDLARDVPVTDGVEVTARRLSPRELGPGITATRSPVSGVYGFRTLPG